MMKNGTKDSKKSIFVIVYIFLGIFVLIMGYFTYYIIVRSDEVINSTYNKRQEVLEKQVVRGEILAADGEVLAETIVDSDGNETREYPYGDAFAHIVGRFTKGKTGIEATENIHLLTSNINSFEKMYADLNGEKSLGDNIVTTLDVDLQQIAFDALGNNRGAVVVLEASTGKILAMVSKPSYDPNKVDAIWEELLADDEEESPLLNRATQGLYPPGSTFKVLTALEYMRENPKTYLKYEYDCSGSIEYGDMIMHCYNNESHGKLKLAMAFAESCNTSFASIGKNLSSSNFYSLCEDFLFNTDLPINIESNPSSFTLKEDVANRSEAMQTAIGQGNTLITPLHNAMIAAAVANEGVMMKPYVVDHIENAEGSIIKRYSPKKAAEPMTKEEAEYISKMMRLVVTDGTGTKLNDLEVEVAGKTGSADQDTGKAHAWFIGFAPYKNPEIVVSVIVESVGTGSNYAVPIAKEIFQEYFNE